MTTDLQIPKTETAIHPPKINQIELVEKIILKEPQVRAVNEDRFKRYKKNLQRRAGRIF